MKTASLLAAVLIAAPQTATAQAPIDSHVHLWNGEKSIADYEAQVKAAGLTVGAFGGMWFGGPENQALVGNPDSIRAHNDALLELAQKYPNMVPIATVHPYDGSAALDELQRVAARGVKLLKIHPHTQRFDPADPRVLALVRRAGELGVISFRAATAKSCSTWRWRRRRRSSCLRIWAG